MDSVKNGLSKVINIPIYTYGPIRWLLYHGLFHKVKTFVENRVREIRENTNISWSFYCESKSNPADLLTSCKDFVSFQQNEICWRGGTFLSKKNIQHSQSYVSSIDNDVFFHELKTSALKSKNICVWSYMLKKYRVGRIFC